MLTNESRLREVYNNPLIRDYYSEIMGAMKIFPKAVKLGFFLKLVNKNDIDTIPSGINQMILNRQKDTQIRYEIWNEEEQREQPGKETVSLYHFPAEVKGPFAVICSGGAYGMVASLSEGYPVAAELNKLGITAFVLNYRVNKNGLYPAPMDDLARAVKFILDNSEKFNVFPENYAVFGFSAGGHLAASFGTDNMGYRRYSLPSPAALILSYPIFTMGENGNKTCIKNLLGKKCTKEQQEFTSVERHIDQDFPPAYIWAGLHDPVVPFHHILQVEKVLIAAGIPHRIKPVETKTHGLTLGIGSSAEGWFDEAVTFWKTHCHTKAEEY